jgi:hypothetical protein
VLLKLPTLLQLQPTLLLMQLQRPVKLLKTLLLQPATPLQRLAKWLTLRKKLRSNSRFSAS